MYICVIVGTNESNSKCVRLRVRRIPVVAAAAAAATAAAAVAAAAAATVVVTAAEDVYMCSSKIV